MPIYQSNGKTYNIPDAKVQDFLKARPDAKEHKAKESPTLGFGMRMTGERTNPEANTFDEQPDQKQPVGVLQSDTATPEQKQAAYSVPEAPTVQQTIASAKTTAANVPGKRTEEGMANYTKALQQTRELLSSDKLDEDQKREVLYQFTKNFGTLNPDENPDITSDASAYLNEHGAPSATARIEAGWNAVKDAAGTLPGLYGTWNAYKNGLPDKEDLSRIVEEGKKAIMPSNTTTQRKVKNYLGKTAQGQQDVKDEQAYMDYLDKQYEEMKANLEKFKKEKIDGKRAPGDAVTVMQQTSAGAMPQTRALSDAEKAVPVSETWREDSNDYNVALQKLKGIEQLREQAKDAKEKGVLGQVIGEVKRNAGDLGMQLATFGTSKVAEGQAENAAMQRTGKEAMTRQANELRAAYDSKLAEQMTMGQAITQGGLQSLPFTEQFLVTGLGTGAALKGSMAAIDKALATGGVKAAMKVALPEITIAAAQTAISPATYARAYEKANQDATQNGQPAGGMLDYLPKVLPEMFIENQTERFGELGEIMKAGGRATKPLSRFGQIRNKLAHYTGVQGVWGEYGEEVLGNVENAALNEINMGDRQTTWQDVVDPKQNLVTFGTVLFSQMPMNTIAAGGYVASKANNKIQIHNIKKGYSKNVANMIDVFGENDAQNAMNLVNEIVDGGRNGSVDALKSAQALDKAIEDGDFTEQEKEAMLHYAMSYAPMKGLQREKDDRSKPIRDKAKQAVAGMVNKDMGSVVTVKTSPEGAPISIAGGRIAQNPDGSIDLANSTETVYYKDASGRVQVLPTSSISEVVEIVPADQAVAQADQAIKESIDGRVDDEQADDYEVGDTAAFTLPGSTTSMAGQVQAIDGAGNYVIVAADGQPYTVAPRYMKPKDFNTMDNGDILIYTDENGNLKKATVVDGFNTPGVFVMDNGDKITPDAVQDLIKPTEGGVNNGLQERNGKEKVNNGGDANVPNAPAAAEVGAVDKRVSDSATPAAGNTEAENTEAISNDPYADFPKKKDGSLDTAKLTPAQALQYAENEQGEDFALESAKIAVQSLGKKRDRMQQQMQTEADIAARVSLKKEIDATEAAIQEYTDYAKARDNRFGEFIPNTFSQRLAAIGEPTTPQEAVAEWLAGGGKIRWSDKVTNGAITAQGFGAHLGYGNEERKKYLNVTDNKNGLTPEQLGEYLTDNDTQGLFSGMTGADATNVVLEVLRDANSRKTALDYLEQTRGAVEADNTEAAAEQQETEQSEPEWVPPTDDEIDWGPMGAPATDEEIQNAPFELAPTEEQLTTFAEMEDEFETIRKSLRFARGTEREQLLKRKGELVRAFVKELVGDSKIVKVVDRGEGLRKEMASVGREASYDTVVKAGAKVKGVALTNGIVVINAEEATSLGGKNSVTDTLFHEHEHVLNDKDSSNIVEVMDNMTRQEMLDFVYSRGGAQVYNSYEDSSLADEVLAFGMGGLYATRGDIKAVAGNNAFLSNFLKQLYDGRRELQSGGLRGLQSGGRRELRASGNAGLQRTDGRRNVDDNNNGEAKGRATGEANGQKRGTYDSASLGADRRNDYSGNEGIDGGQSGHEGVGDNAVSGRASSERTVRGSKFEADDAGHVQLQAVYHGSPHDFEKFTLDKVGTGEGGRSFGYGIYTTEVEDVARQYATQLRGQNKERIVYKGKTYGWSPEKTAYDTLQKMGSKTEAIADAKKWLEYVKKDNPSMIDFWEGVVSILKSSKKSDFGGYSTNLYTISIPDDTGSNYLDWTQPATKEQKDRILDELIKEPSASKWVQEEMLRAVDYKERTFSEEDTSALKKGEYRMSDDVLRNELDEYTGFDAGDGAFGYKRLITILGNDRAASALLSRAGFSGIKYPVGSLHGRKDDGTRNYVIFNDNDLRIDDHVRFSMEDGSRQEADYAELVSKLNSKFNEEIQQQIDGTQEKGHIYQLGNPSAKLRSTGIPDLPIELKANKLLEKSTKSEHSYDLGDIKNLVEAIQNPLAVFSYGDKTKAQNIIAEIQKNGKNFLVGLSLNPEINGKKLEVNSVRNVFPKDNAEWLNWISENKGLYIDKERVQKLIDQQRINLADVEYLDLNSIAKIVQEFKNSKISDGNLRFQAVQENVAPQQDADYMAAVESGDMETAQKMVDAAAERNGYTPDSSYQGSIAFNGAAPGINAYFTTKEERKAAWENGEYEGDYSLGDYVDYGIDSNDLKFYTSQQNYNSEDATRREAIANLRAAAKSDKRKIKIYRAVDADVKENNVRNGDWVTPSRSYAKRHIDLQDWKKGRIIEQEVSIDDLWWNGDDIAEWGYDDGKTYAYKNTANNRKELAVTYDDKGNVISLSKRFNSRNKDPRFQIIGEQGARALDMAEEATTRIENLATARSMESAKKDAKAIKFATGWERGADGKWRYEVNDFSKLLLNVEKEAEAENAHKLKDYISAPELLSAYPKLGDIDIVVGKTSVDGVSAEYDEKKNKIVLSERHVGRMDNAFFRSLLIHEVQHAIQDIEGFAPGGSAEDIKVQEAYKKKRLNFLTDKLKPYEDQLQNLYDEQEALNADGRAWEPDRVDESTKKDEEISKKIDDIISNHEYNILKSDFLRIEGMRLFELGKVAYNRLAGEAEARNAEARADMTPEQRRNSLLSETEDVAREDQLVLLNTVGKGAILSLPSKRTSYEDKASNNLAPISGSKDKGQRIKNQEESVKNSPRFQRVSSQEDADYMAAVESGDMETAQKMVDVAAKKAGYTIEAYHGTYEGDFTVFDANAESYQRRGMGPDYFPGFHFGTKAAAQQMGDRVIPVYLKLSNPKRMKDVGDWQNYVEDAKKEGHDGFIYKNDIEDKGSVSYAVFDSNQIKSADPVTYDNSGTVIPLSKRFEKSEDDIRFDVENDTPDNTEDLQKAIDYRSKKDRFFSKLRENYQERYLPVKKLYDELEKEGVEIKDFENLYLMQKGVAGKNQAEIEQFKNQYFQPMIEAINKFMKRGFTLREAENYVMLKHGLERNATMGRREADKYLQEHPRATAAKIESILARDYAGVATIAQEVAGLEKRPTMESANEIAAEYIRETEGSAGADAIKALWDSVRNATTFSLRKSYRSGQLSKKGYDELIARWQYYVPLRGHDATTAEDLWDYSESGTLFSNPIKKAKGRTSRAESPFAFIEQQAESAITSGNKNALKATILNLAESGKTGKLFSIGTAWYVKSGVDMNGNVAWEMAVPAWNEDPDIYAANVQAFEDDMKTQEAMGEATHGRKKLDLDGKFIKPSQALEHEIVVKRNGEDIVIYVNGNPDLARSINGANRTVYDNWAFNSLRAATRGVAAAATSLNPLFVASNFSRDLMYSSFKLTADNGIGFTTRYLANIPKMAPALNRMLRGKLNLSNESDKMAYEFMMNGGPTGYVTVMDLDRVNKQMQRELKKLNVKDLSMLSPKKQALLVKHATAAVGDFFSYLNEMAENVVRLSTYATARQSGQSVAKAVETAKNVTVDFNSRGAGGWGAEVFNSLWMFTNVGLQAFQNFAKTTKEHPFKVAAMLTMYMLSGFMQPWWIDLFCDEETAQDYARLSDWDRRTNFCIPDFKGHFIKIPISQELRAFHGVGDGLYQAVRGQKDIKEVGLDFASSMADVVPFGQFTDIAEVGYTAGLPTLAQPFFQWRENTNFMGAPVRNRYKTEGGMGDIEGEPGYAKVRVNRKGEAKAPAMLMDFAQFADVMTGGDGVNKGWFSPNPDELEHFARGYFGGLYTTIMGTANSLEQIATTGEVRVKDTPLKRFVVSASELDNIGGGELSNYYKLKDKAGEAARQYNAYLKQVKEGRLAVTDFKAKMEEIDYRRWKHVDDKIKQIDKVEKLLKSTSGEEQATIDAKAAELKRELLNEVEQYDNNNKK